MGNCGRILFPFSKEFRSTIWTKKREAGKKKNLTQRDQSLHGGTKISGKTPKNSATPPSGGGFIERLAKRTFRELARARIDDRIRSANYREF